MQPKNTEKGRFYTFEGLDGCGKTTQINRLADFLAANGRDYLLLREPGGTMIGEEIREILLCPRATEMVAETELLLFAAARAQLVREVIRPALMRGTIVISDRFTDSTLAYQGGGRGLPTDLLDRINELATDGCRPELTFYLWIPPDHTDERLARRATTAECEGDRIEQATIDFRYGVYARYEELAERDRTRIKRIDATQSIEAVWQNIEKIIREDLQL